MLAECRGVRAKQRNKPRTRRTQAAARLYIVSEKQVHSFLGAEFHQNAFGQIKISVQNRVLHGPQNKLFGIMRSKADGSIICYFQGSKRILVDGGTNYAAPMLLR